MLRNSSRMEPKWNSWRASQAPDKSPSWTGQPPGSLPRHAQSQLSGKGTPWTSLPTRPPASQLTRQVSLPNKSATQSHTQTSQLPGHVSVQDMSASRKGQPTQWVRLQDRSPQRVFKPLKANRSSSI